MKNSLPFIFWQMYLVFNAHQRRNFFLVLILLLFQSAIEVLGLGLILPLLYVAQYPEKIQSNKYLNFFYDGLSFSSTDYFTIFIALVLIGVFIGKGIFSIWLIKIQTHFSHDVSKSLIKKQTQIGFNMDYLTFKKRNSNQVVQDMVTIPIEFAGLVVQPSLSMLSEILVASIVAIGVAIFNLKVFFGLVIILVPPIFLFYKTTRKRIVELGLEKNKVRPEAYKHVFGAVHGIESLKVSHTESYFMNKISDSFKVLFQKMAKLIVIESIPIRVIEFAAICAVCFIVIYSVIYREASESVLPLLVVFATAAYRLMPSLNRIVSSSVRLRGSRYIFDRLTEFSENSANDEHIEELSLPFDRNISINGLKFKYPESKHYILDGINFEVQKGEFVGLIGKSGQGKSTLLKVLLKLYEPSKGNIKCDSIEITKRYNKAWQTKIGYVQQSVFLLDGTIEENVAFGEEQINEERVKDCLKAAALEEYVNKLKFGQKSLVGEFGSSISGGQKQRLAVARALYKQVKILVLDEATSALDTNTEAAIMQTLEKLKGKGLTIIVVAHRLTSLYVCDRIYEIGEGKVLSELSYTELTERS